ncbi:bifunctional diguanylate cyclase/phosphodiesterase [Sphingobium sp. DEHP117]|uniref:putative bifunctional diguanylate cyclase/phosphodiesterase n=1 Tax=Sphingobium sp. DEHP117 TaxID=2993436 RepID=UPI0027D63942|nr:EAL domain-containing protein [Sphingobium sp. DEHP117]MDQ4421007.1 bifunctional diguanylate cyclase/phosphodiesterase [Sphingobium sp. DEHP117]
MIGAAAFLSWRQRSIRRRDQRLRDRERICTAIQKIGSLDFDEMDIKLEGRELHDVKISLDKLRPAIEEKVGQLAWQADHDSLTNLLNANAFRMQSEHLLTTCSDLPQRGYLIYFDVNHFKRINDTLGHHAGDQVLVAIADRLRIASMTFAESRLQEVLADGDREALDMKLARLGGDEFVVFVPGDIGHAAIEKFVQRLQRLIYEPCAVGIQTLRISVSIGIAAAADNDNSFDRLLAAADSAMYAAKSVGGNTYRFFSEDMKSNADRVLEKEIEIRSAVAKNEFELYFQPQLNLRTGRIDTVEALIRWNHPEKGLVLPNDFIGFAETHGLIDEIGDWVITEAAKIAARWRDQGFDFKISLNISPKQLQRVELIPLIRASLAYHGVSPEQIEIEITEAAIMRDEGHSFDRLESLRKDGVKIALDDFGTGYSNISQLMMLPMDRLKLDRSLINDISMDQRKWVIASGMINLAKELGFLVVAEGVETRDQYDLLAEAGCDFIQGFFLSRPLPEQEMLSFVGKGAYIRDLALHSADSHARLASGWA